MIDPGIILAAGRSTRMGRPKALLDHPAGGTVLERLIDTYRFAGARVYVVAHGEVLQVAHQAGAEPVSGDPEEEMIDSLVRGLDALPSDVRGTIVQPVDAPFTSPEMIVGLLASPPSKPRVLTYEGRPGHPVWVPRALFSAIRSRPVGGLRTLLTDAEPVPWSDSTILADVDTPEDRDRWFSSAASH